MTPDFTIQPQTQREAELLAEAVTASTDLWKGLFDMVTKATPEEIKLTDKHTLLCMKGAIKAGRKPNPDRVVRLIDEMLYLHKKLEAALSLIHI